MDFYGRDSDLQFLCRFDLPVPILDNCNFSCTAIAMKRKSFKRIFFVLGPETKKKKVKIRQSLWHFKPLFLAISVASITKGKCGQESPENGLLLLFC